MHQLSTHLPQYPHSESGAGDGLLDFAHARALPNVPLQIAEPFLRTSLVG